MLVRKKNYYHQNLPNETKLTYQTLDILKRNIESIMKNDKIINNIKNNINENTMKELLGNDLYNDNIKLYKNLIISLNNNTDTSNTINTINNNNKNIIDMKK